MHFEGPLEDRVAIREVIEAYGDAVTQVDGEVWASLWAEDSKWELPDLPELGTMVGKKQIVENWHAAMKNYPGLVFIATPGMIKVKGDQALARVYTSEVYDDADGKTHRVRGQYDDTLVKQDGRWLIKHRVFRVLHEDCVKGE
ncbi:MAG: nuclear transport factor 2 family protein [Alphaproteobacteria bacterium]|nr:MAG: nuclear transport factor 2 family protein [Alphaproteobacteria bacterium]